jgi:hypothetical protein
MNNLTLSNEKNVYIGYLNQPVIDGNVIGFDYIRITKEELTDTVRVSGQDGLWFLDTDFSNYYESGNFCVFDYGNINLTRKPEYVWTVKSGGVHAGSFVMGIYTDYDLAKKYYLELFGLIGLKGKTLIMDGAEMYTADEECIWLVRTELNKRL